MKFKGKVGDIPFTINVLTDDVACAVEVATRLETRITVVADRPARERQVISADDLGNRADMMRSRKFSDVLRLVADVVAGARTGSDVMNADDEAYQQEQGAESTILSVQCTDDGDTYVAASFRCLDRAMAYVRERFTAIGRPFAWIGTTEQMAANGKWEANATDYDPAKFVPSALRFTINPTVLVG